MIKLTVFKDGIKNLIRKYKISNIDKDAREYLKSTSLGDVVDVLNEEKRKYYTCPKGMPSEYCSKENITSTFHVLTESGNKITIKQHSIGLNFEAPCDDYYFEVFNEDGELMYKETYEESMQKKKINKKK